MLTWQRNVNEVIVRLLTSCHGWSRLKDTKVWEGLALRAFALDHGIFLGFLIVFVTRKLAVVVHYGNLETSKEELKLIHLPFDKLR